MTICYKVTEDKERNARITGIRLNDSTVLKFTPVCLKITAMSIHYPLPNGPHGELGTHGLIFLVSCRVVSRVLFCQLSGKPARSQTFAQSSLSFRYLAISVERRKRGQMAFTLYSLLEAGLLIVNAIAVLNEERFLRKIGWGREHVQPGGAYYQGGYAAPPQSSKAQIINLVNSVRTVMRFPLIILNTITIVLLIIAG